MKAEPIVNDEREACSKKLAVELTDAAYQVALRYGISDQWLDMQLDLWKVITQTIDNHHRSNGVIESNLSPLGALNTS